MIIDENTYTACSACHEVRPGKLPVVVRRQRRQQEAGRLNCIRHLLDQAPYRDMKPVEIEVPPRQCDTGYKRPKMSSQNVVPEVY